MSVPIITGLGLITPLGGSVNQTWRSLVDGKSISAHARLDTAPGSISRVSSLAIHAAKQAVSQAGWEKRGDTALVVATSKGPIESWMTNPSVAGGTAGGLSQVSIEIAQAIPLIDGPQLTISAACASGLHALTRAALMIRACEAKRVLVVAAEASVHPLFLSSFQRLGVLPPPGSPCRPFDQHRQGFLMSDGAAAVCLESDDDQPAFASIENCAIGGDATHLTAVDPHGKTLRRLLKKVIDHRTVDFIHAHGTGTILNDAVELAALESELYFSDPIVYSHKGAIGHSLGAAGLISIVLTCLSHATDQIPPNIHTHNPLQTKRVRIFDQLRERTIRRSLICASGFGGAMAVVSLVSGSDGRSIQF